MGRKLFLLGLSLVLISTVMGCGGSSSPKIFTLFNYTPIQGESGDYLDRAFYITSYPGTTLSKVTLYFSATTAETYTIQLQALDSAFNGTLIGTASGSFSGSSGGTDYKTVVFDFNNVAVTKNHVVAFKFSSSGGSGYVYFSVMADTGGATSIVRETDDTNPPLSTDRRGSISIKVEGEN